MTGPEHYQQAERYLSAASFTHGPGGEPVHPEASAHQLTMAQVHATLALAAATALNDTDPNGDGMPGADCLEWQRIAGTTEQDGAA